MSKVVYWNLVEDKFQEKVVGVPAIDKFKKNAISRLLEFEFFEEHMFDKYPPWINTSLIMKGVKT